MVELLIVFIGAGLVLGTGAWIEQRLRPTVEANDDWTSESRGASRW